MVLVNLELARIAVQKGQTEQALRYYHNAIYAAWPSDQEGKRREARLELIEFLLNIGAKAQAQAELIALQENLGNDPVQQERVGDLFLRAQDYEHALAAYRQSLKLERDNRAALAGAGFAAFELGRYPLAQRYLQAAVAANPNDTQSAERLKTDGNGAGDGSVPAADYRWHSATGSWSAAFTTAGERLKACSAARGLALPTAVAIESGGKLGEDEAADYPRRELRRNPDLVESAMDLVFDIERQTSVTCGTPTGADMALLLIAKLHEGN